MKRGLLILLLLLWALPGLSLDPDVTVDKYLLRHWTTKHGLPQNTVHCMVQDRQGFIWLGTENGLARFDGSDFKVFDRISTGVLKSNRISALYAEQDGTLWIRTGGGDVMLYKWQRFRPFNGPARRLPNVMRPEIAVDRSRVLRTVRGNLLPLNHSIENSRFNRLAGLHINAVLQDEDKVLWVASDRGLYRLVPRNPDAAFPRRTYRVDVVNSIAGFPGNIPVVSLFEDKDGSLWIGTRGRGVFYVRNSRFKYYTPADGLSDDIVNCIYQDSEGTVWIGTGSGLNRLKNGEFTVYTNKHGLLGNNITSVCRDRAGDLWIGTPAGLNRLKNAGFDRAPDTFTVKNGLPGNYINVVHRDRIGNIWIGTGKGLGGYKNGRFFRFQSPAIVCATDDDRGRLWLGTRHGLLCLDIGSGRFLDFANKKELSTEVIRSIYVDWEGTLWLGTEGRGVICLFRGEVFPYPKLTPFSTSTVYYINEDKEGNLWLTSGNGLYVLPKHSLSYYRGIFSQRFPAPPPRYYRLLESDGLRTVVFSGSGQPAGWKATNSRLWLPTMESVAIVDPAETPLKKKPGLTVIFEKLEADGITHLPHNIPVLPSDTRSVSIYFSVLNFRGFENLKFKYYLVSTGGRKEEAVIDGGQKKLELRDLEQSGYHFYLSAGNNERGWSKEPLHFSFSIKYRLPWQEMALFIFIACLAVSIVVALKILDRRNKEKHMMRIFKDDERYKTSGLKVKQVRKHMLQLLRLMEEEKLYLDPELSVTKLAERLGLAKEHISQIINQQFYMNFNQFLNKYRIEEAKKRLKDPKENQYVVLKIAYDVGFNSKSTFNTAFKKFTGMSPSQFREKYQEKD